MEGGSHDDFIWSGRTTGDVTIGGTGQDRIDGQTDNDPPEPCNSGAVSAGAIDAMGAELGSDPGVFSVSRK